MNPRGERCGENKSVATERDERREKARGRVACGRRMKLWKGLLLLNLTFRCSMDKVRMRAMGQA